MKIIFNHTINDWYWQIYDELRRNHNIILPENYRKRELDYKSINLDALEKVVNENSDCDLIFDFSFNLDDIIRWKNRNIKIPIVIFAVNAILRPYLATLSVFANIWYVEKYAKETLERYNRENLIYRGLAANPYAYYPMNIDKIFDIGFIGRHYGERGYWLNLIQKFANKYNLKCIFPLSHGEKLFLKQEKINELYNQTKINISFAPKEPPGRIVNLRTFEICMSGNFQLMQYTPCIEDFFEIDKEIACWKNKKDLFEKILYYLENEDEREKIANNGYKRAINDHTWSKRIQEISFFLEKKKTININKYAIPIEKIIGDWENDDVIQNLYLNRNKLNIELIKALLRKLGDYKLEDIKMKSKLKIDLKDKSFFYKPNLKTFLFIEFYGKIMMVINVLPINSELKTENWEDLKKILFLTKNPDYSLPQFGLLTNGNKWIIRNFKHQKWLRKIPTRRILRTQLNLNTYIMISATYKVRVLYKKFNITKLLPFFTLKKHIKLFYDRLEKLLQILLKSPRALIFN